MEAPKEALADAAGDSVPTTAAPHAAVQESHQPQRIVASHPAPPQRNALITRDRFNHQSLGASLNSSVKHVRLFSDEPESYQPHCTTICLGDQFMFLFRTLPPPYNLIDFYFYFPYRRCSLSILIRIAGASAHGGRWRHRMRASEKPRAQRLRRDSHCRPRHDRSVQPQPPISFPT
jgi:hypothetical protein